jgi:hypothetical protein
LLRAKICVICGGKNICQGFLNREAEVVALTERLCNWSWQNQDIYPQPSIHPMLIRIKSMMHSFRWENFIVKKVVDQRPIKLNAYCTIVAVDGIWLLQY